MHMWVWVYYRKTLRASICQTCLFALFWALYAGQNVDALPFFSYFSFDLGFSINPLCLYCGLACPCLVSDVECAQDGVVRLFSLHICPTIRGTASSDRPRSDWARPRYLTLQRLLCCSLYLSGSGSTLLPARSGHLPAWVAQCAHYAWYYHIAVLGEVAKCIGVWFAVKLPMYPEMGARICLCLHLGEIRLKLIFKGYKISCALEFPTFLHCHCYCGERSCSKNIRIFPVCPWKHVFIQDEVNVSSLFLPASWFITARQMGDEGKNKRSSSLLMWSLYIFLTFDLCDKTVFQWHVWDVPGEESQSRRMGDKRKHPFLLFFFLSQMLHLTFSPPGESRTFTRLKNKTVTHVMDDACCLNVLDVLKIAFFLMSQLLYPTLPLVLL